MSGFFGMVRQDGKPVEERLLQRIADELTFRGPDGSSVWRQANVAVASHGCAPGPRLRRHSDRSRWGTDIFSGEIFV